MSRHTIRSDEEVEVVVGWDPPLQTFFALVYDVAAYKQALVDDPDADHVIILWEGTLEHRSLDEVEELVRPWVSLTHEHRIVLYEDEKANRA